MQEENNHLQTLDNGKQINRDSPSLDELIHDDHAELWLLLV